nr:MAG TPA_asm: hypothetical protein [Caudoviricetes sp.]
MQAIRPAPLLSILYAIYEIYASRKITISFTTSPPA